MDEEKTKRAIELIRSGNKQAALPLLKEILNKDVNNVIAWSWLYACVDNNEQKKYCLHQVLRIQPENKNAQAALARFEPLQSTTQTVSGNSFVSPLPPSLPSQPQMPKSASKKFQKAPSADEKEGKNLVEFKERSHLPLILIIIAGIVILFLAIIIGKGIINRFSHTSETYSEIGVFVLNKNGGLVQISKGEGTPSSGDVLQIDTNTPTFILNAPEIDLTNLDFELYKNGQMQSSINYRAYEVGNAYRVDINNPLSDGTYCFVQSGPNYLPGVEDIWCVRVGKDSAQNTNLSNMNIAPPADGLFVIINQTPVELPEFSTMAEVIKPENVQALPVSQEKQPVLILQSADINLSSMKFGEVWGYPGVSLYDNNGTMLIARVYDGSPAKEAGVEINDILLKVNNNPDLDLFQNNAQVGDTYGTTAIITVQRGTKQFDFDLQRTFDPDISKCPYDIIQKQGFVYLIPTENLSPSVYCLNLLGKFACFRIE
jgi:hypothetical protein